MALIKKAEDLAHSTKNWRAEAVETSRMSGHGINLQNEVHIKIAAQTPLKMRGDGGDDQTLLVCDVVGLCAYARSKHDSLAVQFKGNRRL